MRFDCQKCHKQIQYSTEIVYNILAKIYFAKGDFNLRPHGHAASILPLCYLAVHLEYHRESRDLELFILLWHLVILTVSQAIFVTS